MIKMLTMAYELTKLPKITHLIRYGDDSEEINEIVVIGVDENGQRQIKSFKAERDQIGSMVKPYVKYDIEKSRDQLTKRLFIEYLDTHTDERFFQAIRNFAMSTLEMGATFVGVSSDGMDYKDTFYVECDDIVKGGTNDN